MQITVEGNNTTIETAATVQSYRTPGLDFSGPTTPAVAAQLVGTDAPDFDFTTPNELNATLSVDGGAPQAIALDAVYADIDDLIDELQSQTTGATWSEDTGVLVLTSDTANSDSSLDLATTPDGTADIFIDGTDEGEDEVSVYVASVTVDGGTAQDLILDTAYVNLDELIVAINAQLTDCTAKTSDSQYESNILQIVSDTTGSASEIEFTVLVEDKSAKQSLYINEQDVFGLEYVTTGATLLVHSYGGSIDNPTVVTVQNVAPDPDDPFTGPVLEVSRSSDLTFGTGIQVYAGATASFSLISGDELYATTDDGEEIDTRVDASNVGH